MLCEAIVEFIAKNYSGKVVEVGIGHYHCVARRLADMGFEVVATDLKKLTVPEKVKFYVDDITNPNLNIYRGARLVYSLRPPPELHDPILSVAKEVGADCLIRPFGNEFVSYGRLVNYRGERFYVWRA